MVLPSGDHTGAVGSSSQPVILVAGPPAIGITHSAPWALNTRRWPSGDGATAILVPSCSSTVTSFVDPFKVLSWLICGGVLLLLLSLPPQAASSAALTARASMVLHGMGLGRLSTVLRLDGNVIACLRCRCRFAALHQN